MDPKLRKEVEKDNQELGLEVFGTGGVISGYSTGFHFIDYVSGVPGIFIPRGHITELFGLKSTGKSTLVQHAIANAQRENPDFTILYMDYEGSVSKSIDYGTTMGVNFSPPNFIYRKPETLEDGADMLLKYNRLGNIDMIVIDTVAAMRPRAEKEATGVGEAKQRGLRGKLMSELLRNLNADLHSDGPAIVFINHMYEVINTIPALAGRIFDTPASNSLKYYALVRYELKLKGVIKKKTKNPFTQAESDTPIASLIRIKGEKNKMGAPFLESEFAMWYGHGVEPAYTLFETAKNMGIVQQSGGGRLIFTRPDGTPSKSIAGEANFIEWLIESPNDALELANIIGLGWPKIIERLSSHRTATTLQELPSGFEIDNTPHETGEASLDEV